MTDNIPPYPHPPITECVFDFRCNLPAEIKEEHLRKLAKQVADCYPVIKPQRNFESQVRFDWESGDVQATANDLGINGYICWDEDKPKGQEAVQFRLDGFSYNKLQPYSNWQACLEKAINYWEKFRVAVKPALLDRVSVRYINTIKVPKTSVRWEIKDYLTGLQGDVELPPDLLKNIMADDEKKSVFSILTNRVLETFVYQDVLRLPDKNIQIVKTRTVGALSETVVPLIVDIEVTKFIKGHVDNSRIKEFLNELRGIKNVVFEQCITDESRKLFK